MLVLANVWPHRMRHRDVKRNWEITMIGVIANVVASVEIIQMPIVRVPVDRISNGMLNHADVFAIQQK